MASDGSEVLSDEFDRWVDEQADALDISREAVLARVLVASAEGEEDGDGDVDVVSVDAPFDLAAVDDRLSTLDERVAAVERDGADPERVASLADRLDDLDGRMADLDAELDEKIEDVRERVIQVKRETDAKAAADHGHPELRETVDRAATALEALRERLDGLETRVDEGFDNYEEVLEYLTETSDDLEERATTLARATIDLRDRVADLEGARSARAVTDDIRAKADRNGDATASCGACSRTVRLGLLSRPECPHCAATFADVEPSSGLFGSATLVTGRPPALDGETATPDSPDELFADGDREGAGADE